MDNIPAFLLIDSDDLWGVVEDEETGEKVFFKRGRKAQLIHTKSFGVTELVAIHKRTGSTYTIKGPAKTSTKRGSWTGEQVTQQQVLKFPSTTMFRNHVRERYQPDLAERLLVELEVA